MLLLLDLRVNLMKLELAGWWDDIIENMFEAGACTHYRLLVEPLDIANSCLRLELALTTGYSLSHSILLIFTVWAKPRTMDPN